MYITQADIATLLDTIQLISCTDDLGTGNLNTTILNNIIQMASGKADALVSSIYTPFGSNPPAKIKDATICFACFALLQRRLTPTEHNPYKEQQEFWIKALTQINAGELSLDDQYKRAFSPVLVGSHYNRANGPVD